MGGEGRGEGKGYCVEEGDESINCPITIPGDRPGDGITPRGEGVPHGSGVAGDRSDSLSG